MQHREEIEGKQDETNYPKVKRENFQKGPYIWLELKFSCIFCLARSVWILYVLKRRVHTNCILYACKKAWVPFCPSLLSLNHLSPSSSQIQSKEHNSVVHLIFRKNSQNLDFILCQYLFLFSILLSSWSKRKFQFFYSFFNFCIKSAQNLIFLFVYLFFLTFVFSFLD